MMKKITILMISLLLSLIATKPFAETGFELGRDYQITSSNNATEPVLEEFFNYACGGCYSMETFIVDLKKTKPNLKIRPIPVELHPSWKIYVEAFFIGQQLGVLEQSHPKLFHFIHVEKKRFKNQQDMKAFFLTLGVTEKDYDDVAGSYWLTTQLKNAKQYAFKHRVDGTPTLLINERYKLDIKKLGTYSRIDEAIDLFSKIEN